MTPEPDFTCDRCQETLPWYVADAVSDDKRAAIERHLASCARCQDALDEWREVALALRRTDEGVPTASPTTWAQINRQLGEQAVSTVTPASRSTERINMRLQDRKSSTASPPDEALPAALPRGRSHVIVGLAVVALVALSAGIFSYFATHGGARRSTFAATPHPACAPSLATVNLPANTTLSAIAPLGRDDGWAVGNILDYQHPTFGPSAVLLRLRNCHWAPIGEPIPHAALNDISMVSLDEGWAVGVTYAQNVTLSDGAKQWAWDQPFVLHYTHGSWQKEPVSAAPKTSVEKVKMVSATEGWMLLYDGKHLATLNGDNTLRYGYSLRHYQNGTWADVPLDFLKIAMSVSDLDARQPGEVWLVGINTTVVINRQSGFAAHYSNGAWTLSAGAALGADTPWFQSISELAPNDVWASAGSGLYHFDGARWTQASIQGNRSGKVNDLPLDIGVIVMISPTQGWAFPHPSHIFGYEETQEEALRYENGVWRWTAIPLRGASTPLPITSFAPSSPTQGWAIAFQVVDGFNQYVLLYYDAGAWGIVSQQS